MSVIDCLDLDNPKKGDQKSNKHIEKLGKNELRNSTSEYSKNDLKSNFKKPIDNLQNFELKVIAPESESKIESKILISREKSAEIQNESFKYKSSKKKFKKKSETISSEINDNSVERTSDSDYSDDSGKNVKFSSHDVGESTNSYDVLYAQNNDEVLTLQQQNQRLIEKQLEMQSYDVNLVNDRNNFTFRHNPFSSTKQPLYQSNDSVDTTDNNLRRTIKNVDSKTKFKDLNIMGRSPAYMSKLAQSVERRVRGRKFRPYCDKSKLKYLDDSNVIFYYFLYLLTYLSQLLTYIIIKIKIATI